MDRFSRAQASFVVLPDPFNLLESSFSGRADVCRTGARKGRVPENIISLPFAHPKSKEQRGVSRETSGIAGPHTAIPVVRPSTCCPRGRAAHSSSPASTSPKRRERNRLSGPLAGSTRAEMATAATSASTSTSADTASAG